MLLVVVLAMPAVLMMPIQLNLRILPSSSLRTTMLSPKITTARLLSERRRITLYATTSTTLTVLVTSLALSLIATISVTVTPSWRVLALP